VGALVLQLPSPLPENTGFSGGSDAGSLLGDSVTSIKEVLTNNPRKTTERTAAPNTGNKKNH
jgi:hypothetical protein